MSQLTHDAEAGERSAQVELLRREEPRLIDTIGLVALPTAITVARLFVADTLHRWQAVFIEPDMEAIVGALVAISVETTGPAAGTSWTDITDLRAIRLRLLGFERHIVVEVADEHDVPLLAPDRAELLPAESGLTLVDERARDWGSYLVSRGRVMWAELDVYEQTPAGLPRRRVSPGRSLRHPVPRDQTAQEADYLQQVLDGLGRL